MHCQAICLRRLIKEQERRIVQLTISASRQGERKKIDLPVFECQREVGKTSISGAVEKKIYRLGEGPLLLPSTVKREGPKAIGVRDIPFKKEEERPSGRKRRVLLGGKDRK